MSCHTVPGQGGFFELEHGEELFLTPDMIPEPHPSIFTDNPHETGSNRFKRWRIAAKARYSKAWYKAQVEAKNEEHFLLMVGEAKDLLVDPAAWENYKSCRGIEETKRPVGRPRLSDVEKLNRPPRSKRSDKMKLLLEGHGIVVQGDGSVSGEIYEGWSFTPNGKLKFEDEPTISTHTFLMDYC